jgi:ABC-type bacteriocin/lantibiotic exporter with double-glycine peptidase domain
MILAHYGRVGNSLDSLVALTEQRRRGLSFAELQRAAAAASLSAQGWIVPAGQLGAIATPAIVHFPNHYVVLDSIRQRWAYLRDPAIGRVRMTLGMLAWWSTRRVLVFTVGSTVAGPTAQIGMPWNRPALRPPWLGGPSSQHVSTATARARAAASATATTFATELSGVH